MFHSKEINIIRLNPIRCLLPVVRYYYYCYIKQVVSNIFVCIYTQSHQPAIVVSVSVALCSVHICVSVCVCVCYTRNNVCISNGDCVHCFILFETSIMSILCAKWILYAWIHWEKLLFKYTHLHC